MSESKRGLSRRIFRWKVWSAELREQSEDEKIERHFAQSGIGRWVGGYSIWKYLRFVSVVLLDGKGNAMHFSANKP